jgi:hypothetical protein
MTSPTFSALARGRPTKPPTKRKPKSTTRHFVKLYRQGGGGNRGRCARILHPLLCPMRKRWKRRATHCARPKPGTLVALSVGEPLVERETVQQFWRKHYQDAFAERMEGSDGECMISGKFGPIAPTHEKIKGVSSLGGQASGVALMSFDKEAFRSYGWEQNRNSPVSPDRALAYVLAFNDLLKQDKGRRKDIAGIGFLLLAQEPRGPSMPSTSDGRADPQQVKETAQLRSTLKPGRKPLLSGCRLRQWRTAACTPLGGPCAHTVKEKPPRTGIEQLRVEYPLWGEEPPRSSLAVALCAGPRWRNRRMTTPCWRCCAAALKGLPLGYLVLSTALTRLRHPGGTIPKGKAGDKKSDPMSLWLRLRVPIGLIRMCINDQCFVTTERSSEMSEGLDPTCPSCPPMFVGG